MDLQHLRVLLIEDNPGDVRLIRAMLANAQGLAVEVESAGSLGKGLEWLGQDTFHVVLLDLSLPDSHGLDTFRQVHQCTPTVPVVILSGADNEDLALEAMHAGAQDYLNKGRVEADGLIRALRYAVERYQAEAERLELLALERAARAEAEAAQARLAFLAEASDVLARSLDYETTLASVARLTVPRMADFCVVHVLELDGRIRRMAAAHSDPRQEASLAELRRDFPPPSLSDPSGVASVLRTGEPDFYPDVPDAWLAAPPHSSRLRVLQRLGAKSFMAVPLTARGRLLGVISLATADSGRKYGPADLTLAQALAQRCALAVDNARLYREAKEAVQVRDQFLAAAAHDLKTPLTSIKGNLQLIQRRLTYGAPKDWLRERLDQIAATTTRMTLMVNDLLDLVRLEAGGRLQLVRRPTDLVELIRTLVTEYQQVVTTHAIRFETDGSHLLGDCDAMRLERVLTNLLNNAVQYSPEGSEVTVRLTGEQSWALLEVVDQGLGIPAAERERVFERFYRATNVKDRSAGLGIGLAGVRQIVEWHGGQVSIDSVEGQGTTIMIRLPLADSPPIDRDVPMAEAPK